MRRRRNPEIIAGRVNADGSIAAGDGFTVQKGATGIYTLTITAPGFRILSIVVTTASGGNNNITLSALSATGAQVNAFVANTATAGDLVWNFVAVGAQQ